MTAKFSPVTIFLMLPQFLKDKAREISYALIRVAYYVKRDNLRFRLEALAVDLLENAAKAATNNSLENLNQLSEVVSSLDGLVRLGHSVYEIEPVNATILVRELDGFNSAIRQSGNPAAGGNAELPDLETFFNKDLKSGQEFVKSEASSEIFNDDSNSSGLVPIKEIKTNGLNTAIRQAAIVNRVKSGNHSTDSGQVGCRLKDLLAEFTDVSERTLRYDLQRLCEQGIIERIGNGGPASYYRVTEGQEDKAVALVSESRNNRNRDSL